MKKIKLATSELSPSPNTPFPSFLLHLLSLVLVFVMGCDFMKADLPCPIRSGVSSKSEKSFQLIQAIVPQNDSENGADKKRKPKADTRQSRKLPTTRTLKF